MNIWKSEKALLINKIWEERGKYLLKFGEDPDYLVIPLHYRALLEPDKEYSIGCYDTYLGMQIIESKNCFSIDHIKVY